MYLSACQSNLRDYVESIMENNYHHEEKIIEQLEFDIVYIMLHVISEFINNLEGDGNMPAHEHIMSLKDLKELDRIFNEYHLSERSKYMKKFLSLVYTKSVVNNNETPEQGTILEHYYDYYRMLKLTSLQYKHALKKLMGSK